MRMGPRVVLIILMAAVLIILGQHAPALASGEGEVCCDKVALWEDAPEEYRARKYAPDREVDVLHLVIDVTPDFKARTIAARASLRFAPIAEPLEELRLDAVDFSVLEVDSSADLTGYQVTKGKIVLTFAEPIAPGTEVTVAIAYEAEPRDGLFFKTPELGYLPEDTHLWTQGETHRARHWYPSLDYPNERFTSEVICRVPEDMIVVSNGRLISETEDPGTGLKAVRWLQDKPHVSYLVALVAGKLEKIEGQYGDIPLAFYTPSSQIAQAANSFRDTADMMGFFEEEIGVPYPWDKYDQAVVDDFVAGGMENTTLTILTDRTLFTDEFENARSSESLVAHELVHQWFGDYVTCKDWSHVWLNEGFATYYQVLYAGHKNGQDDMLYGLYRNAGTVLRGRSNEQPIVSRDYGTEWEQFGYRAYQKGGWVLHMLRTQLGEALYRQGIKEYLERNALGSVVTEDLNSVLEEVSGRSLDQFFDQWVYHAHHPELRVSYSWVGTDKLAKVSVQQTQELSEDVVLFSFPTKVRFKTKGGIVDREIFIHEKQHDFYFALEQAPTVVRFDPEYGLLAKVTFSKPNAMLYAQLADQSDVIGRLLAIEALKSKKDKKTVEALNTALNEDEFHGVRMEACRALDGIHTKEAFAALADSTEQSDARVREQVIAAIAGFYSEESRAKLEEVLDGEKNPDILAQAIVGLGRYHDEDVREIVLTSLRTDSYRNEIANAAIKAIRRLDDPTYIAPLKKALPQRERGLSSRDIAGALGTLAYIARNEEKKDGVREFLAGYVDHDKQIVQRGAISALGTLKDVKAISIVETFAEVSSDEGLKRAAEGALESLRAAKEVPVELKDLRSEVLELKKESANTKAELEDLKKKLEAREDEEKGETEKDKGNS